MTTALRSRIEETDGYALERLADKGRREGLAIAPATVLRDPDRRWVLALVASSRAGRDAEAPAFYVVEARTTDGGGGCDCPGYEKFGRCKHFGLLLEHLRLLPEPTDAEHAEHMRRAAIACGDEVDRGGCRRCGAVTGLDDDWLCGDCHFDEWTAAEAASAAAAAAAATGAPDADGVMAPGSACTLGDGTPGLVDRRGRCYRPRRREGQAAA